MIDAKRCHAFRIDRQTQGMSDYRKLQVWRKAHSLALDAHRAATSIKGNQYSAFRSQIIRSAMSIPANIVEGREQKTEPAFARYLRIALSSASELEYHLTAANDIQMLSKTEYLSLKTRVSAVRMMLHGLIRRVEPAGDTTKASALKQSSSEAGGGEQAAGSG